MMHPSLNVEQAQEWEAWRDFCNEFEKAAKRGVNDPTMNPAMQAVKLWGERLVALRLAIPEYTTVALTDAEKAYARVRTVTDEER